MCTRKSSRVSKLPVRLGDSDPGTAKEGFDSYDAEVSDAGGDGSQSTVVSLKLIGESKERTIAGATGSGYGHAEMHALHQALVDHRAEFDAACMKVLTCQEKPCCFQCSVILGLAGICSGEETYKSKKSMGSTEWGASAEVKQYIEEVTGVNFEKIAAVRSYPD